MYLSDIIIQFKICSVVFLLFLNPACSSAILLSTNGFKRFRIILNNILLACDIILTVRYFSHFLRISFFGIGIISGCVQRAGHSFVSHICWQSSVIVSISWVLQLINSSPGILSTHVVIPFLRFLNHFLLMTLKLVS